MLGLLSLAVATLGSCPVERAHYALRHDPDVTAHFLTVDSGSDWPSGLALAVLHRKSGKTFWWLPWNGGSNNLQNVASTEDVTVIGWHPPHPDGGPRPYGNRQYVGTDGAYDIIGHIPRRGELAPVHMLFPDSAGGGDIAFPTRQFFDLVSCPADDG